MTDGPHVAPPGVGDTVSDPLVELRAELEQLEDRPVAERVARFEQANETLARELALLDEV